MISPESISFSRFLGFSGFLRDSHLIPPIILPYDLFKYNIFETFLLPIDYNIVKNNKKVKVARD